MKYEAGIGGMMHNGWILLLGQGCFVVFQTSETKQDHCSNRSCSTISSILEGCTRICICTGPCGWPYSLFGLLFFKIYQKAHFMLCFEWFDVKLRYIRYLFCVWCEPIQGRITEIKRGATGHSIAVKCNYHRDCSILKTAKAFSGVNESLWVDRIMAWLHDGPKRIPDRNAGFQHKKLFGVLWQGWKSIVHCFVRGMSLVLPLIFQSCLMILMRIRGICAGMKW